MYQDFSRATNFRNTIVRHGQDNCQSGSVSDTKIGWTIGGGLEWAFAYNWSLKGEYLYYDLGTLSHLMTDPFFPADRKTSQ